MGGLGVKCKRTASAWSRGSPLPEIELPKPELEDDFDLEPVETPPFSYGDFQLVGHGKVTNEDCGRYLYDMGCMRVDLHNKIMMVKLRVGKEEKIVSTINRVYRKHVFNYCHRPTCPTCHKFGWASRLARKIEVRLLEASKRFGQPEHIIATVNPSYYGLSYAQLREKIKQMLRARGVIGGVMIFHPFRFNERQFWYWSPHFHVLGFILGGYKCRRCKKIEKSGKCGIENVGCNGFVNRNYREYEKDCCIFKVKGERRTLWGTARYQLDHSGVDVTKKRFHVAVWFGCCSYRKLKVKVEDRKSVCPCCLHDLERLRYVGKRQFCLDRESPEFKRESFEPVREEGFVAWFVEEVKWSGY